MKDQRRHRCILLVMTCVVALWVTQPCMALVVSELMYHPVEEGNTPSGDERLEFVELYNDQATSEDLSGYKFTNGIGYTFAAGTILGPKGYLVVAREPNAVKAAYGISVVYGPFTGRLDNDGERIELSNANGEIIISFRYNDTWPWPNSPDGTGHSLILAKLGGDPEEASSWSASTYIGGTPGGPDGGGSSLARLVINELLSNSHAPPGTDWLEIYNPGPIAVDLNNVYLSDGRFDLLQYKIPSGVVLQPGQFWAVREGAPPSGFPFGLAVAGETIFLTAATTDPVPKPLRVLDAVRFGPVEPDRTLGRFPNGTDSFVALTSATYQAANTKPLIRDIVINEIMYHHPTNDDRYEYVELYNRGASTVSLAGWDFTDGISYDFNDYPQMSSGSYLVVAKDPNFLKTVYNNLVVGSNLVGPYTGNMSDHSERVRLSYPIQEFNPDTGQVETLMVTEDEVTYYDGGRWPKWADGQGASMELRDPKSNNNTPDAWADSNESSKTTWQQFSFTISDTNSQYTHTGQVTVFDIISLNRSEALLDDLELIIGGTNRLSNSGFESGESGWRILGNHTRSFVTTTDRHSGTQSLHLISTGHGDPGANRINRSITSVTGGTVQFRFWARWLRGTRYLLLRVTQPNAPVQPPRPSHSFELPVPLNLGTPGQQNTAFISNRGPDILEVRHTPVLPTANQPIVVTARVTDNDGVSSVTLYYRSEGTTTFTSTAMVDNGSGGDQIAGDGIFTATIPGAASGTMRAFYITASDGSASSRFPTLLEPSADVPNRTCLVRVGDAMPNTQFAIYRVWLSNDVINAFRARPNLSNELMDCTFVYNNTEVFYNCGIRYRGSPFIRSGSGTSRYPYGNYAYRINFDPDRRFRSCEEMNLDNTEGSSRGPLQERASYWFYRQMGLQYSMQEFVRLISNGNNYGNYEDVQNIEGDYVDMWFPNDNEGYLHKIDDYFEYTADGTGFSNIDEGLRADSTHPLLPETYRWHFEKRSHREDNNWQHLFNFAVAMNTPSSSPNYEQVIESVINPQRLTRVLAVRHAVGDWDSYGYRRGKNNYFYYASAEDKWYLLPWDIDFTLGSGDGTGTSLFSMGGQFPEVSQFLNYPKYKQMYLQAFRELVSGPWQTSYPTVNPPTPTAFDRFLDDAANALIADGLGSDRRDGIKAFVSDRRAYILTQIPPIAFEITTNSGYDFCIAASMIAINGTAPQGVVGIAVNGTPMPAKFSDNNVFEVNVPLLMGTNPLTLQGLNSVGYVFGSTDSITVTRVPSCAIAYATPSTACNSGTAQLTIYGSGFEPGSMTSVALTSASEEIGFDALYVQNSEGFDAISAATLLLDDPTDGIGDPVYAVHPVINLLNNGNDGVFSPSAAFAPPFDSNDSTNYAVRFTGYIYAPSPGIRYFGVNSDEGFTLSINGQLVGEYAYGRTTPATTDCMQNRTAGTMMFSFPAAGRYYIVLDYFENSGGEEIELFQTNSTGGDMRLINVDSELVVFRDNPIKIDATNVVVADANTITCQVDVNGAEPGMWDVVVTPECGQAAEGELEGALQIVTCSRCDFNRDAQVNFSDWSELGNNWHRPCSSPGWCAGMDLDQSGHVDIGDVAVFAEEWLLGDK